MELLNITDTESELQPLNGSGSAQPIEAFVVDDESTGFFAPARTDLLDRLLGEYSFYRDKIDKVVELFEGELGNVIHYFVSGRKSDRYSSYMAENIFQREHAIKALDAAYWGKAIALTDVLEYMPAKKKHEWQNDILEHNTPEFEEGTLRSTLATLLASRELFFAQRIDGIFQTLSRHHSTNRRSGFTGRQIMSGFISSYGGLNYERCDHIHDLRACVAKFMGRTEPSRSTTLRVFQELEKNYGQWQTFDGGALRLKLFKVGTVHMEVADEMAWRLNNMLASIHPTAIPSEFRTPPKRKTKSFDLGVKTIDHAALNLLCPDRSYRHTKSFSFPSTLRDSSPGYQQACEVLESLGGVFSNGAYHFEYEIEPVLLQVVAIGVIPDQKSHQYYSTSEHLAQVVIDAAEIGEEDTVLEPSAGTGAIAKHLPVDRTTCVEVAPLRCSVLKSRGMRTIEADFIEWADETYERFSKIVMNPPFQGGRAILHLERAASLLKPGGRLVAILPGSMRNKECLPGFQLEWSKSYLNEFADAAVAVVVLTATRDA